MQRICYDTVSEAMRELRKRGYTIDFSSALHEDSFILRFRTEMLSPKEFEIDHFYRFEGETDPGDGMIVYAISSKKNDLKGIVVNAYGMYADKSTSAIVRKLEVHQEH